MAITEACQIWVEQRIQEELEGKAPEEQNIRAIGRTIALEIYRHFECQMNPETIKSRILRVQKKLESGSNEPSNDTKGLTPNQSPRKHRATGQPKGGSRSGAGRPPVDAMAISRQIIRLLDKIRPDDPAREDAIVAIENHITELDGLPSVDGVDEEEMVL